MTTLVEKASGFLESRLSRRSFINRSAYVGSTVAIGAGLDLVLKPTTAYALVCTCGNGNCGCGSQCCAGFSEFCCSINGGYNYCPTGSVMGGWWKADNSSYCNGPRYYMDCHAQCHCDTGCGNGWGFCETGCDSTECGCGPKGCDSYVTGCFQFRYGQCNQQIDCIGRIVCRVVACIPPWEIDPTCTTTLAVDNSTAEQNEPCWTPATPSPPPATCSSVLTACQVVGLAPSSDGNGYGMVTSFGRLLTFGDFPNDGDESAATLDKPIVGIAERSAGGYYLVGSDGGIFAYQAPFFGSMGGQRLNRPIVGMAANPSGNGYWFVAQDGGIFSFGDAPFLGSMGGQVLNRPIVGMAATPSGLGYWLVASDGGIFSFGDAPFLGSMGAQALNRPVVGIAATPSGRGYWMVASDGGIFSFGDAPFLGSMGGQALDQPIVGMAAPPSGQGYWFVAQDGGIFAFDVPFLGSAA
jgi:ribosomal protein L24E